MIKNNSVQSPSAQNSLKGRLILATFLILPIFCGLLGWSLDKAFTTSVLTNEQDQLMLQAYSVIASADLEHGKLILPKHFTDDRLNQAASDLFAAVYKGQQTGYFWRSSSALNIHVPVKWRPLKLLPGQSAFGRTSDDDVSLFFLQYSVVWDDEGGREHTFQIIIFERQTKINRQISAYRQSLWGWLSVIALSMTVLQILILNWGLKPLGAIANDLEQIRLGNKENLEGTYPLELKEVTSGLNTLLENESRQRERYKNTLSDLAHSLKTPLAIMKGELDSKSELDQNEFSEQITQIDKIVSYQLKRANTASEHSLRGVVLVRESCEKVVAALQKVYRERQVSVAINIECGIAFKGEKGDLLEILGNLLDNAFKYGGGQVLISARFDQTRLLLNVEDNGKGISEQNKQLLLQRGERADTSEVGQGIGLSVVTDIVSSYRGSIELGQSKLGGLSVELSF